MNLTDLHTFCLVAETGTISAAAKRLDVPKSTVSRRVRRLEDALGHDLLRRSPRAIGLTEHGRVLHQRSHASLRELQEAVDAVGNADSEPSGTLRITTVPGFGHTHRFLTCIRDYGLKFPKTVVDLQLTTRLVNLVEEGFDVGVRLHMGPLPGDASLMSRRLLRFGRALYASPTYVEEMGTPSTLDELDGHRLAAHAIVDVRSFQWLRDGKPVDEPQRFPAPRWRINDSAALERFVVSGGGLALVPTFEGERLCALGELVRVLPAYEQAGATASLIWPASRHLAPRVRAFIDHSVTTLGDHRPASP